MPLSSRSIRPGRARAGAFTLIELLTVIAIVAVLAGIVIGAGRRVSEVGKVSRAKAELAALTSALENYRRQYGDYPRSASGKELLQALVGKRGPTGATISGRVFLDLALVTVGSGLDPLANSSAELVDPWDQPYRYAYKAGSGWTYSGYLLFSLGSDGKTDEVPTDGIVDFSSAANADNVYANR